MRRKTGREALTQARRVVVKIGTNALTIYLISNVVKFDDLSERFAGGPVAAWFDHTIAEGMGAVVLGVVGLLLCFAICRFLHRRQLFLRL